MANNHSNGGADWMWQPWDCTTEPHIMASLTEALERAETAGLTEEEINRRLVEALNSALPAAIDSAGTEIADELLRTAPRMLAEHRRFRISFESRLAWVWGEALDLLYALMVCCGELGADFNQAHRSAAVVENDHRFEALVGIHARACLTASEIHSLLRTGHGFGARARWRTLHELAVVSSILAEGDDELSNRFLLHASVEAYQDALLHEQFRERTGREPFPSDELADLARIHELAVAQYGSKFTKPWAWAREVTSPDRPTFRVLEEKAQLDHLRPDYRTSSHLLHGGSSGTEFVRRPFRGGIMLLAGPSNAYLVEPGHAAAISLMQVTTTLVVSGRPYNYSPIVTGTLKALQVLVDATGVALLDASEQLEILEENFRRAEERGVTAMIANNWKRRFERGRWRTERLVRRLRQLLQEALKRRERRHDSKF